MILLILGWECLRWAGLRTIEQYGPGAAERRQGRLMRLREQTAATIEAELRQRSGRHTTVSVPRARRRGQAAIPAHEGQRDDTLAGTSAEGGSGSTAVATIGTMTLEEVASVETREVGVQAELGFTYLAPEPTRTLRIETVPHPGPYYLSDHGGHVHIYIYRNCWGLRNTTVRTRSLCRCCEQNEGRSLYSDQSAR